MDPTDTVKCQNPKCEKSYSITKIQWHLSNNPKCKSIYTSESYAELEKMCEAYRKNRLRQNYERKKSQKKITFQVSRKISYSICISSFNFFKN